MDYGIHPHWETVQATFQRCYDGSTAKLERVKKNVSTDLKALGKQVAGSVLRMVAYKYGHVESLSKLRMLAGFVVRDLFSQEHLEKLNNKPYIMSNFVTIMS